MASPACGALAEADGRLFMALLDMSHFIVDQLTGRRNLADPTEASKLRATDVKAAAALSGTMYSYWDAAPSGPGVHSILLDWTAQNLEQAGPEAGSEAQALFDVARKECSDWSRRRVTDNFQFAGETEAGEAILVDSKQAKAYAVLGISKSLGDVLRANGRSPLGGSVRLTLLPFMGKILYDAVLMGAPPAPRKLVAKAKACADAAVASDALVRELPTPPPLLGRRVRISGLQSRPELNGTHGKALEFVEDKGRYVVRLEGRGESVRLKPDSLEVAAPLQSAAPCKESCCGSGPPPPPLEAAEAEALKKLAATPALRGSAGEWIIRRVGYSEADNPRHEAVILAGTGAMVPASPEYPMLRFRRLAPTPAEYLGGLLATVAANGNKRPFQVAVDEQSAVARLQTVLAQAGIAVGYYPPPSDEELTTMGGHKAAGGCMREG